MSKPSGVVLISCSAFQQYVIKPSLDGYKILQNEYKLPWSAFVGVVGMPGKSSSTIVYDLYLMGEGETAYYSWKEYSSPKKGEVAFVSTAAGKWRFTTSVECDRLDATRIFEARSGRL